jgi:hypothetical protein
MRMEAIGSSEASVDFYETTRRHMPTDYNLHSDHRANLRPHRQPPLRSPLLSVRKEVRVWLAPFSVWCDYTCRVRWVPVSTAWPLK